MNLLIMRHGDAVMHGSIDAERPLSARGVKEVETMANWLVSQDLVPDYLVVSPYLRAQQTAKVLTEQIIQPIKIETLDLITPDDSPVVAHNYLDGLFSLKSYKNVLVISHMPLVSYLTAELTFDNSTPIYATANIAQIDYNVTEMTGKLLQMVCPYDLLD